MSKVWTDDELEFLADNAGWLNQREIGKALGRSLVAVQVKQKRLHIRFVDNIYTVYTLAHELGQQRMRVQRWVKRGWLVGKKASWSWYYGETPMIFKEDHVVSFLRAHANLFNPREIPNPYFANVVREVCSKSTNS